MRSFTLGSVMMVLALGAGLTACTETSEIDSDAEANELTDPGYRVMGGGTGVVNHNGLDDAAYYSSEVALVNALSVPVTLNGSMEVNKEIGMTLLATAAGKLVFDYAVRCTIPSGTFLYWKTDKFEGVGVIEEGKRWLEQGLGTGVQRQVLSCMIAHINKEKVNILLQGAAVHYDGLDHPDYDTVEALWVTESNVNGSPLHYAWPLAPLQKKCWADPFDAIAHRVCGHDPAACAVKQGNPADCQQVNAELGQWTCRNQPAIQTSLRLADFDKMYVDCAP